MKTRLEILAEDWLELERGQQIDYTYEFKEAYKAGFRKAVEMAAEIVEHKARLEQSEIHPIRERLCLDIKEEIKNLLDKGE